MILSPPCPTATTPRWVRWAPGSPAANGSGWASPAPCSPDPDVLVMDEPTSSLDVLHEKELLKTLQEGFQDKMIFLVSHRPSTLTGVYEDCAAGKVIESKSAMLL